MFKKNKTSHLYMSDEVIIESEADVEEELPLLTFNALYNILREEKKSKSLQKYPSLFYEALEKFIQDRKQIIKNEQDVNKRKKEQNILKNATKIAEEVISLRSQKIAKIATSNAMSDNNILDEENILKGEEELHQLFTKQVQKLIKRIS
jgi:DNA replication initiation complex subunit (GINS family)